VNLTLVVMMTIVTRFYILREVRELDRGTVFVTETVFIVTQGLILKIELRIRYIIQHKITT
jgi:hypothetical protein